jgi:hypothetical protein
VSYFNHERLDAYRLAVEVARGVAAARQAFHERILSMASAGGRRDAEVVMGYRKKSERLAIAEAWHQSGLTQRAFAGQHGFSVKSLQRWVRELRKEGGGEPVGPLSFVEVKPVLEPPVRVVLPSGVALEVPPHVAPERVRALALALC